jgi:hypothetical protein
LRFEEIKIKLEQKAKVYEKMMLEGLLKILYIDIYQLLLFIGAPESLENGKGNHPY